MNEPNNMNLTPSDTRNAANSQAPAKQSRVAAGFKNRTKGEGLFNFGAYFGVGYVGVTAFSVYMTWLLRDFKPIAKHYTKIIDTVAESSGKMLKVTNAAKHHDTVNSAMTIMALFFGGTVMSVLPIKWLEDNKAEVVKGLDRTLYGKEKSDNDPSIQAAHDELEKAPKQTWKSVLGSRVLAFAATLTTWWAIGSNVSPLAKATQKEANGVVTRYGDSIDRHSSRLGRWVDGALNHKKPEIVKDIAKARAHHPTGIERTGTHPDRVPSRVFSYIALDAFYTMITGGALYIFTRVLAPVFDKHDTQQAPAPAAKRIAPAYQAPEHTPTATTSHPAVKVTKASAEGRLQGAETALAVS